MVKTVYILGAGFSRAIGNCTIKDKLFQSPLDKDFFSILQENNILKDLLSDKPCLTYMLDWMKIYDKNSNDLKERFFSLENFWTNIDIMKKLNSSISGFPDFYLLGGPTKSNLQFIPNIDEWKKDMPLHEQNEYNFISRKGNFFNPEGVILYFTEYELKKLIFQIFSNLTYKNKEGLVNTFKQIVGEDPIISFNYDCLLETIFDKHDLFNYDERLTLRKIGYRHPFISGSARNKVPATVFSK